MRLCSCNARSKLCGNGSLCHTRTHAAPPSLLTKVKSVEAKMGKPQQRDGREGAEVGEFAAACQRQSWQWEGAVYVGKPGLRAVSTHRRGNGDVVKVLDPSFLHPKMMFVVSLVWHTPSLQLSPPPHASTTTTHLFVSTSDLLPRTGRVLLTPPWASCTDVILRIGCTLVSLNHQEIQCWGDSVTCYVFPIRSVMQCRGYLHGKGNLPRSSQRICSLPRGPRYRLSVLRRQVNFVSIRCPTLSAFIRLHHNPQP